MTRAEPWEVLTRLGHGAYVKHAVKEHIRLDTTHKSGDADARAKITALAAATKAAFEDAWGALPILSLAVSLKTHEFDLTFVESEHGTNVTISQEESNMEPSREDVYL